MIDQFRKLGAVLLTLLAMSCASMPGQRPTQPQQPQKNIVFILVDDLGWADIGALNAKTFYETPNIDRLAAKGALFTQSYAASPVCSPSRVALLTGTHPTRLATTDWFRRPEGQFRAERFRPAEINNQMPLEQVTLAERLRDAGYRTAFLGKWHLGNEETLWPEHQGFEVNIGGNNWGGPPGGYFSPYKNPRLKDGPNDEYLTDRLTSEAIGLMDRFAAADQPFLLYLSFYTVHVPLEAPADTIAKYAAKGANLRGQNDFANETQYQATDKPRLVRVKQNHATYAAMVEALDRNVGRLMARLEQDDLAKDTIIVFTSDNGGLSTAEGSPTSNLPLRGGKGWLYEGGIRVPLILYDPGSKARGRKIADPVAAMDIVPTLLDLAHARVKITADMDGRSIRPALDGQRLSNRPIVFHYPHYSNQGGHPGAAIRLGRYKLIENFETGDRSLYDLVADPGEQNDLAARKPAIREDLTARLHKWYTQTNARFLRPLDTPGAARPWQPPSAK